MDISSWITFDPAGGDDDDIDSVAQSRLASSLQATLRNQIDPGIDLKSARLAQSIRVQASGGQIVIDEDDQGKILTGGKQEEEDESEAPAGNLEDLFRPGSGVPEAINNPDGSTQLVFRSISAANVFGQQITQRRGEMVERITSETLRNGLVDAIEEASREAARKNVTGG